MGESERRETSSRNWAKAQGGWRVRLHSPAWHPPTDLCETEDAYLVDVEVAGMKADDFSIQYTRGLLSIRGCRSKRRMASAYHQIEISTGEFVTEVHIPGAVNVDEIEASYQNGFLRLTLPKHKPKSFAIGPHEE